MQFSSLPTLLRPAQPAVLRVKNIEFLYISYYLFTHLYSISQNVSVIVSWRVSVAIAAVLYTVCNGLANGNRVYYATVYNSAVL